MRRFTSNQGSILIVTLWIVALLALLAVGLTTRSRLVIRQTEYTNQEVLGDSVMQALIEHCVAQIQDDENTDITAHNEAWGQPLHLTGQQLQAEFGVTGVGLGDLDATIVAIDEYGKVNINAPYAQSPEFLVYCFEELRPNVSAEQLAFAILDWGDVDNDGAAENDFYQSKTPAYQAMNNDFRYIEELLFVKGVSPLLYWGEDSNHNHVLESEEDDGDLYLPLDNNDGILQYGLRDIFTTYGDEGTGHTINLNTISNPLLKALLRPYYPRVESNRLAELILKHRRGADGVDGTEDDQPFSDIKDLKNIVQPSEFDVIESLPIEVIFESNVFRFHIVLQFNQIPIIKKGTVVIIQKDGNIEVVEWHEE